MLTKGDQMEITETISCKKNRMTVMTALVRAWKLHIIMYF